MPCAGLGRELDDLRVAAVFFGDHVLRDQSFLTRSGSASGLSILFIATTSGTSGRLRMLHRFLRLRHHAVVGRDDQHHDVGDLGAARAHRVNASWPGVSRKVIMPFGVSTW